MDTDSVLYPLYLQAIQFHLNEVKIARFYLFYDTFTLNSSTGRIRANRTTTQILRAKPKLKLIAI